MNRNYRGGYLEEPLIRRTICGWWIWFPRLGRVRFAPVGVRLVCVELTRPEAAEFLRALRRNSEGTYAVK